MTSWLFVCAFFCLFLLLWSIMEGMEEWTSTSQPWLRCNVEAFFFFLVSGGGILPCSWNYFHSSLILYACEPFLSQYFSFSTGTTTTTPPVLPPPLHPSRFFFLGSVLFEIRSFFGSHANQAEAIYCRGKLNCNSMDE